MQLHIRTAPFTLTPGLESAVQQRIEPMLRRYARHVRSVSVSLSDINGPRHGEDKCCRIVVQLDGNKQAIGQATDADMYRAIALAGTRTRLAVARRLLRRMQREPLASPRYALEADDADSVKAQANDEVAMVQGVTDDIA